MKANKTEINKKVAALVAGKEISCKKLAMANIVMPTLESQGLMALVFPGMVITKEQPKGCFYGATAAPVIRVLGGKVLSNGMADAYAWSPETYAKKAKESYPIGFGYGASVESVKWAMEIVNSIGDPMERELMIKFFLEQPSLRLVFSAEENRTAIEVTQELFDAGLQYVIDDWMKEDELGLCDVTQLNVGDYLIVTKDGYYCIRREEFLETHSLD